MRGISNPLPESSSISLTDAPDRPASTVRPWSNAVAVVLGICGLALACRLLWLPASDLRGGYDETRYVLLGEMIADPEVTPPAVPKFPPGWPAVLAACFRVGWSLSAAHRVNLILTWIAMGSACLVLHRVRR